MLIRFHWIPKHVQELIIFKYFLLLISYWTWIGTHFCCEPNWKEDFTLSLVYIHSSIKFQSCIAKGNSRHMQIHWLRVICNLDVGTGCSHKGGDFILSHVLQLVLVREKKNYGSRPGEWYIDTRPKFYQKWKHKCQCPTRDKRWHFFGGPEYVWS